MHDDSESAAGSDVGKVSFAGFRWSKDGRRWVVPDYAPAGMMAVLPLIGVIGRFRRSRIGRGFQVLPPEV